MKIPELLRSMGVMGIPTMIGYHQGQEVTRKTGAMTPDNVQGFFAAVKENKAFNRSLSSVERIDADCTGIDFLLVRGNQWSILLDDRDRCCLPFQCSL